MRKERNIEDAISFILRCQIRTNVSMYDYINQSIVIPLSKEVGIAMSNMFHDKEHPEFQQGEIKNEWFCDNQISNVWLKAVYADADKDEDTCCGGYTYNENRVEGKDREGCIVWNERRKNGIYYFRDKKKAGKK